MTEELQVAQNMFGKLMQKIPQRSMANFAIKHSVKDGVEFSVNCVDPEVAAKLFKEFKKHLKKEDVI